MLYQADWENSDWNKLAAGMADVVLLVANANDSPQITYLEQVNKHTHMHIHTQMWRQGRRITSTKEGGNA